MEETFLYLTSIGRKTGLPRQIEIWFVEQEGRYYIVAEGREKAQWVQNILQTPEVGFSIGKRGHPESVVPLRKALAMPIDPAQSPDLVRNIRALMDHKYGWSDGLIVELSLL